MYSFESRVRYSETDAQGRLTAEKLIDYFQDCSTFQSEDGGVGIAHLRGQGLAWIIVYWRVEIARMPLLGEDIRIGTIPYQLKGGIGLRNFFLDTADGERLAAANSVWTLVDADAMRPVRIPREIMDAYPLGERLPMEYDRRKIFVPAVGGQTRAPVTVREYHLDSNNHVNNGQYVRIAERFLPSGPAPSVLRIEYRRQAVLRDRIDPVVYETTAQDRRTVCVCLNAEDGGPYAVLEAVYS